MKKTPLHKIARYRNFILDRDKALDQIYLNTQRKISDHLKGLFTIILKRAERYYSQINIKEGLSIYTKHLLNSFEQDVRRVCLYALPSVLNEIFRMRISVYTLSFHGESEALGRAFGRPIVSKIDPQNKMKLTSSIENKIDQRIEHAFRNLQRKILTAFEASILAGSDLDATIFNLYRQLPRAHIIPSKVIKNQQLKEAERTFSFGTISDREWENVVADYSKEYIPQNRGPEDVVARVPTKSKRRTDQEIYAWEVERDAMNIYVEDVVSGSRSADEQAGVTDFIWIAIIDDKTDEDCLNFNGKTLDEIEKETGERIIPPHHFNCRCRLAPVVGEVPERISGELKDFASWMKQKETS